MNVKEVALAAWKAAVIHAVGDAAVQAGFTPDLTAFEAWWAKEIEPIEKQHLDEVRQLARDHWKKTGEFP